jgi:hypothetical protein
MKRLILFVCSMCICSLAFTNAATPVHKFYFSNSTILFNSRSQATEWTIKLFADDLEWTIQRASGKKISFKDQQQAELKNVLADYLLRNVSLKMDGNPYTGSFVGFEMENDLVVCYLEFPWHPNVHELIVSNTLLISEFPDQKNIVQVTHNGSTQTLLLDRQNTQSTVYY